MKYIVCLFSFIIIVQPGQAQWRRSYSSCAPSYSYAVPTYYAPTYHETVTYREVIVPVLQPYPVYADPRISYHYLGGNLTVPLQTLGGQQQQVMPQQQPANGTKDIDIDSLIDRIEKRVKERQSQQAYEPDGPPVVPETSFHQVKATSRNWAQVLQTNCAICHTGDKSKGNFVIFTTPGKVSPTFDTQAAWDAIADGRMPPKERPRIKTADKEILRRDFGI